MIHKTASEITCFFGWLLETVEIYGQWVCKCLWEYYIVLTLKVTFIILGRAFNSESLCISGSYLLLTKDLLHTSMRF